MAMAARKLPRSNERTRLLDDIDDTAAAAAAAAAAATTKNGHANPSPRRSSLDSFDSSHLSSGFLSPSLSQKGQNNAIRLPARILPLAFIGGFGIAGTVASIMSVYSYLICAHPTQCDAHEKEAYARTVAAATTVTNVLSVLLLGPVQAVGRWKRQAGLVGWLVARGGSLVLFLVAVAFKSLVFAFAAQALEGASTDGLLHFNLNAAYVENAPDAEAPRLFGLSLGLFMAGLAVGPAVTGMFADPRWGFYIGTGAFTGALIYVLSPLVPWPKKTHPEDTCAIEDDLHDWTTRQTQPPAITPTSTLTSLLQPLLFFTQHPSTLLHGLSLLLFTAGQAFFFPALLIHALTNFAFTPAQISGLVTLLAVATSLNLLTIVVLLPALTTHLATHSPRARAAQNWLARRLSWDTAIALISPPIFSLAAVSLLFAHTRAHLYVIAILASLGNATPPFTKSHLSRRLRRDEKAAALAALALCETAGSLLSPLLVGGAQAGGGAAGWPVFAGVTAGLVGAGGVCFGVAAWVGCPALLEEEGGREVG